MIAGYQGAGRFGLISLVLALLSTGCAGPAAVSDRSRSAPGRLHLEMWARAWRLKKPRVLAPVGATVRDGDEIELFLRVDRPAYVHIVGLDPRVGSSVIFDGAHAGRLPQGIDFQIPPGSDRIHIEGGPREETMVVIASTLPIRNADRALYEALLNLTAPQSAPPQDAPPSSLNTDRSMFVRRDGERTYATADDSGVIVFRFSLSHVP